MKNPFKKLSKEAKGGIIISLATLVFFGSIATVGILAGRGNSDIGKIDSTPISVTVNPSNTTPSSSDDEVDKPIVPTVIKPTLNEVSTVRYFFDIEYDADDPKLQKATFKDGSVIHQSRGMDFANSDDAQFEVIAATDGVVKSITPDDRLYGTIILVEADNGVTIVYAGVKNVQVKVNEKIKQGNKIADSGISTINSQYKNALHFEIIKDNKPLNPEKCFDKELSKI